MDKAVDVLKQVEAFAGPYLGKIEEEFLEHVFPLFPAELVQNYNNFWVWATQPNLRGDPRVVDWPLAFDYKFPCLVSALYLAFIVFGTALMKRRAQPFSLTTVSIIHNLVLFTLSVYMTIETILAAYENFNWASTGVKFCNRVDRRARTPSGFSPSGARLANVLYIHYLSKAYEFGDTILMVFKKNFRQITFLHVYHHVTTFFPVWFWVIKYGPGGEAWFCCFLNSFIHVWMYAYYCLSAVAGKEGAFRKALNRFKPMITIMQMTQFLAFIGQGAYLLYTDCFQPRIQQAMLLVQCVLFFALFANFAAKNYLKPKRRILDSVSFNLKKRN